MCQGTLSALVPSGMSAHPIVLKAACCCDVLGRLLLSLQLQVQLLVYDPQCCCAVLVPNSLALLCGDCTQTITAIPYDIVKEGILG